MPRLRAWFSRLLGLFSKNRRDAEMAEEIQAHLDLLTERNIAAGMSPNEARNAALRLFGGIEQTKEIAREQRVWRWADEFVQDIRYGVRMLRRTPGFSILAILCLTLGIGTNAAALSWIEGILIRPYPLVAHQDRMFALNCTTRGAEGFTGLSYPDFIDLERNSTLFESFIVDKITGTTLSNGDRAERAVGGMVSANYFDALGVRPILGRGFRPEEGTGRNAHPVAVISYMTWKNRYKGDPDIIGKTQLMNGVQHTIIGVAPEKFHGTFIGYSFNFWVPTSMQETFDNTGYKLEDRGARWIEGYAFLKPGVTRQQAQAELSAIAKRLENDYPETDRGHEVGLLPLWKTPFNAAGGISTTLGITAAVVFFVLLIACANVSNLLLARSLLRRHEMTMRLALGAGRRRLIKQLFTEGLLLSLIAALGGIAVAYWSRNALVLAFPPSVPGITIDYPGQTGLARSSAQRRDLHWIDNAFRAHAGDSIEPCRSFRRAQKRGWLEWLAAAGDRDCDRLWCWSRSRSVLFSSPAPDCFCKACSECKTPVPVSSTNNVIMSVVDLFSAGYKLDRAKIFHTQLLDRVRALPGVESAALTRVIPFSYNPPSSAPIEIDGYQPAPDEQPNAEYLQVSEDYFSTLGIPLVAGREFTRTDDENSPRVAIINETMAGEILAGKRSDRPTTQSERQMDANRRCREKCELRDEARASEVVLLCAGAPEFLCRERFAHSNTGNSGRDHECAGARSPRARSDVGAVRRRSFARASRRKGLHSATRGHVARNFRRNGAVSGRNRTLRRNVVFGFAKHPRARRPHGARR